MTVNHVVVDGSNLATEGRNLPSLKQLDEAVRAYQDEYKPKNVIVVVDASFPNRIDASERKTFEEAIDAGEVLSPPAGVIGRGDAFVLEIADRADAVVLSNDSFQEFHGQYDWLFDQGRLIGGKPVPHVGWVFMERSPVRGPASRRSVSDAKKTTKSGRTKKLTAQPAKKSTKRSTKAAAGGARTKKAEPAPAKRATLAADPGDHPKPSGRRRRGPAAGGSVEPYNEALPFIEFVSAHPVGTSVRGKVERFSSHGAYVVADDTRCYLPLKHLGTPAPRSAREVLTLGETYEFVVQAIDTPRRGVDLTMPGVVAVAAQAAGGSADDPVQPTEEERVAATRKKKSAAKKAPAKKKRAAAKKAPARKRKSTAKRAPARKKKAGTRKKAAKKRAPARKKKAGTRKKAAKKRAPARKKKAGTRKKAAKKR